VSIVGVVEDLFWWGVDVFWVFMLFYVGVVVV